jgi:hypothetical protein
VPEGQLDAQVPETQAVPAPHAFPQLPQFWLSEPTLTQSVPQSFWVAGQLVTQAPFEQTWLPLQAVPHLPQSWLFELVSTQVPLQRVLPVGQPPPSR